MHWLHHCDVAPMMPTRPPGYQLHHSVLAVSKTRCRVIHSNTLLRARKELAYCSAHSRLYSWSETSISIKWTQFPPYAYRELTVHTLNIWFQRGEYGASSVQFSCTASKFAAWTQETNECTHHVSHISRNIEQAMLQVTNPCIFFQQIVANEN